MNIQITGLLLNQTHKRRQEKEQNGKMDKNTRIEEQLNENGII